MALVWLTETDYSREGERADLEQAPAESVPLPEEPLSYLHVSVRSYTTKDLSMKKRLPGT
jgi:hypothetical protein